MKIHDEEFIAKCRNIDFSKESANQEARLENLKRIIDKREINMNKKLKKPIALVAVCAMLLCLSAAVYGQDIIRVMRNTITLGNASFIDSEELEELAEQDTTQEQYEYLDFEEVYFYDLEEGRSHFICDVLMPSYLPEGYEFESISYSAENGSLAVDANKYMFLVYSNGTNKFISQIRYMDDETGFVTALTEDTQEIKINGHDGITFGNVLMVSIDEVMYMYFANEHLTIDELIKIAESLE